MVVELADIVVAGATVEVVFTDGLAPGPFPVDWLRLDPIAPPGVVPAQLSFLWIGSDERLHTLAVVDVAVEEDPPAWRYHAAGGVVATITIEPTWKPADDAALRAWKSDRPAEPPEEGGWRFSVGRPLWGKDHGRSEPGPPYPDR